MDKKLLAAYANLRKQEMSEAYDFLTAEGIVARAEILEKNFPHLDCAGVALYEHRKVFTDPDLIRYENVTDGDLREILDRAKQYDGEWYHSYATFTVGEEMSPLASEVAALPSSAGVYITHLVE